jgi:Spy/CpxP family protein refolding chaperone
VSLSLGARAQAVLVLALVASLGALAGIIGDRMLADAPPQPPAPAFDRPDPGPGPGGGPGQALRYAQQIGVLLDLSEDQRARIDSILDVQQGRARELTRELRGVTEETRRQVEAVLTDEQRTQLRTLRQQRLRRPDGPPPRRP